MNKLIITYVGVNEKHFHHINCEKFDSH